MSIDSSRGQSFEVATYSAGNCVEAATVVVGACNILEDDDAANGGGSNTQTNAMNAPPSALGVGASSLSSTAHASSDVPCGVTCTALPMPLPYPSEGSQQQQQPTPQQGAAVQRVPSGPSLALSAGLALAAPLPVTSVPPLSVRMGVRGGGLRGGQTFVSSPRLINNGSSSAPSFGGAATSAAGKTDASASPAQVAGPSPPSGSSAPAKTEGSPSRRGRGSLRRSASLTSPPPPVRSVGANAVARSQNVRPPAQPQRLVAAAQPLAGEDAGSSAPPPPQLTAMPMSMGSQADRSSSLSSSANSALSRTTSALANVAPVVTVARTMIETLLAVQPHSLNNASNSTPVSPVPLAAADPTALPPIASPQLLRTASFASSSSSSVANASRIVLLREDDIKTVLLAVREVFMSQPMLLELAAPVKICGDIHGQYYDLLKIFDKCGYPCPPELAADGKGASYLFLGDYVDRGKHSIETIMLLFCYKILYPNCVWLLRGNHECAAVTRLYGFYDDVKRRYNIRLWKAFTDVFNTMPCCGVISGKIICMHGGLSPDLTSVQRVNTIRRPCDVPESGLLCDILWSDPVEGVEGFLYSGDAGRGVGYVFGADIVETFLEMVDMDLIVRGHEIKERGYGFFADRQLVTVFSAPNYCGEFDNDGAVMDVASDLICSFTIIRGRRVR